MIRALNISASKDSGVLYVREVASAYQGVIDLVLGLPGISGDPGLQVHLAMLKHSVCDNQAVAGRQVQKPLPIVGDLARQAKPANAASPLLSIVA